MAAVEVEWTKSAGDLLEGTLVVALSSSTFLSVASQLMPTLPTLFKTVWVWWKEAKHAPSKKKSKSKFASIGVLGRLTSTFQTRAIKIYYSPYCLLTNSS
jgi:hypothetical protein